MTKEKFYLAPDCIILRQVSEALFCSSPSGDIESMTNSNYGGADDWTF